MLITPRKFDSEIRITDMGKWLFHGQEITQENVLDFFKKNIREDEYGIYITNSYAERIEHGYLEAKSIFLKIINNFVKDNHTYLLAEDESVTSLNEFHFYSDKDGKIFCMRKLDKYIKFNFNRSTHSFISSLITEEDGNYFLQYDNEKNPINPFKKQIEVDVPELYRVNSLLEK